ncbi:MAG: rubrerythrin family protein [Aminivibrio sp.]
MSVKNAMTAEFLKSAYGGESMANMRYLSWADKADREGFPKTARLLRAVAYAEQVHANNHFVVLGGDVGDCPVTAGAVFGMKDTAENLLGAIAGEEFEVDQMYPVYYEAAKFQGEKDAMRTFNFALQAEKQHAELFRQARDKALEGKDMELESILVCPVCGHTVLDEAPDKCPVCGMTKDKYVKY